MAYLPGMLLSAAFDGGQGGRGHLVGPFRGQRRRAIAAPVQNSHGQISVSLHPPALTLIAFSPHNGRPDLFCRYDIAETIRWGLPAIEQFDDSMSSGECSRNSENRALK